MRRLVGICKRIVGRLSRSNNNSNHQVEESSYKLAEATSIATDDGQGTVESYGPPIDPACDAKAIAFQAPEPEPASFALSSIEEQVCGPAIENETIPETSHTFELSDSSDLLRHDEIAIEEAASKEPLSAESLQISDELIVCDEEPDPALMGVEGATDQFELLNLNLPAFGEIVWSGDERRRMSREPYSNIVWVEYLNDSLECLSREAVRTEDVSGGGLRIQVKAAPSDCEMVRISHSNCSFDNYAEISSRFAGNNGYDRLCLRFLDAKPSAALVVEQMEKDGGEQPRPKQKVAGKILLADDDASLRKVLGKILTQAGYEVSMAEDGKSAIEMAEIETPDLVISDLLMPKADGFHVCKIIKGFDSPPKIILLSGVFTKPSHKWEARDEYGADDMVTKPFELADLLKRIKQQLAIPLPA